MASPVLLFDLATASDALPARFLRLAIAAFLTLPIMAWLYQGIAGASERGGRWGRWGGVALIAGAVGMPLLLVAAAFVSARLKYLLFIPADLVFAGALAGAWLAGRHAHPVEAWGWRLVASGMVLGLLLGTFAFGGPLPAPGFLGEYGDPSRRFTRAVHVGAILLGLTGIAVGRGLRHGARPSLEKARRA